MSSNDRVRVRGVTIHRPIIFGSTAVVLDEKERANAPPEHTHRWTVAVRSAASAPDSDIVGGADDLSYFIKRVTFKLHETYANPSRNVDKPPFEVSETGWGEFDINIKIFFIPESGEKTLSFYHHLKLHPWTLTAELEIPPIEVAIAAGPVHSWQYDEIVFNDPFQSFLNILTAHPPTLLPKTRRRPVPFCSAFPTPAALEAAKGGVPEFQQEMEKDEGERLDAALRAVIEDTHQWRNRLIEHENEASRLKKAIEALQS